MLDSLIKKKPKKQLTQIRENTVNSNSIDGINQVSPEFAGFIPSPVYNPTYTPESTQIQYQQSQQYQPQQQQRTEGYLFFRRPLFKTVIAIITANVNGQRVRLASIKVPTIRGTFRYMKRAFLIDLSKAFLLTEKGAYIMYDFNYSEPIEKTVNGEILQTPVVLGDTVHYSKEADMIQNQSVIEQVVRAVGRKSGFDIMTIIFLLIGICIGLPIGIIVGQQMLKTTVAPLSNSTKTTAKLAIALVRMWIMK